MEGKKHPSFRFSGKTGKTNIPERSGFSCFLFESGEEIVVAFVMIHLPDNKADEINEGQEAENAADRDEIQQETLETQI